MDKSEIQSILDSDVGKELIDLVREEYNQWKDRKLSYRDLLVAVSILSWASKRTKDADNRAKELFDALQSRRESGISPRDLDWSVLGFLPDWIEPAINASMSIGADSQKHEQAAIAADRLHSKPGGSREKQNAIRAIWASGKYQSRDICAEQECAALGMSFSTARKALRNTPNPT